LFKASMTLCNSLAQGQSQVEEFKREREKVGQIDVISLYDQALAALTRQTQSPVQCPVCGTQWEREKLVEHIHKELGLLTKVKEDKEAIEKTISSLKSAVRSELDGVKGLRAKYDDAQKIIGNIKYEKTKEYEAALSALESAWLASPLTANTSTAVTKE